MCLSSQLCKKAQLLVHPHQEDYWKIRWTSQSGAVDASITWTSKSGFKSKSGTSTHGCMAKLFVSPQKQQRFSSIHDAEEDEEDEDKEEIFSSAVRVDKEAASDAVLGEEAEEAKSIMTSMVLAAAAPIVPAAAAAAG